MTKSELIEFLTARIPDGAVIDDPVMEIGRPIIVNSYDFSLTGKDGRYYGRPSSVSAQESITIDYTF